MSGAESRDDVKTAAAPQVAAASFRFARGGGRTFLAQQHAPYPFHVTRPHYLDPAQPDLATLYLQSASGGLYRGDRLSLSIAAAVGARAHVTSQAATVVHTTGPSGIRVQTSLTVDRDALLLLTTDPYILFPATDLEVTTLVTLSPGAGVLLAEGFSEHDPAARDTPFARLSATVVVKDQTHRVLVHERSEIGGAAFASPSSPLGPYRAMGSVLILGAAATGFAPGRLEAALDSIGVLAGASLLPNGAGWGLRLLALDGGHLRRGLDTAFAIGFETLVGCTPGRRRK